MHTFSTTSDFQLLQQFPLFSTTNNYTYYYLPLTHPTIFKTASPKLFLSCNKLKPTFLLSSSEKGSDYFDDHDDELCDSEAAENGGIETKIEDLGENSRRIQSKVDIDATLEAIWSVLTDYEKLADFIPGLAVSQLVEKRDNFARLFQIGHQDLAFGLKFNAKGVVDCYEGDLKCLPSGQCRDIDFKMIDGDFQIFEGKWSIEQQNNQRCEGNFSLPGQDFRTTLSYEVVVKPKLWLPVGLVEGRLCREIEVNLSCIRKEAQKAV